MCTQYSTVVLQANVTVSICVTISWCILKKKKNLTKIYETKTYKIMKNKNVSTMIIFDYRTQKNKGDMC